MSRKVVHSGIYKDQYGFWSRPWVNGGRTWRRMASITLSSAIKELAADTTNHELSKKGLADSPYEQPKPKTFAELANIYLDAGCPNSRLEPRHSKFCGIERWRLEKLTTFLGHMAPDQIKMPVLLRYSDWRTKAERKVAKWSGKRAVEQEWGTISNVLNYGVSVGVVEFNFIGSRRPRLVQEGDVRKSRSVAPESGDELHAILGALFASPGSESLAWQAAFAALTGCRTSELLKMRVDAASRDVPGFVDGDYLFLKRSKSGVNPFIFITPELRAMLVAFRKWHATRFKGSTRSKWFFPGKDPAHPMNLEALAHAMRRVTNGKRTPHGLRSFYCTVRRSQGAADNQIAAEIGDKTVVLITRTYADLPKNWTGGEKLRFLPGKGKPAWSIWS